MLIVWFIEMMTTRGDRTHRTASGGREADASVDGYHEPATGGAQGPVVRGVVADTP
jgi:hypothetical protein